MGSKKCGVVRNKDSFMNLCLKHNYPPISINKLSTQHTHNTGK